MNKTRVMNEILKNPFVFIHPDSRSGRYNLNWSGVHLGAYDDAITAMDARDLFVKEWYGLDVYYALIRQYKENSSYLVKFANTYYDGERFLDSNLKEIIGVFRFSYGNKNCYFFADSGIAKRMLAGEISLIAGKKNIMFRKGVFVVRAKGYDFGVESVNQLVPEFKTKHNFKLTKRCCKTGKYSSYFRYNGKTYEKGRFENPIDAQNNSFDVYFNMTGFRHKFDPKNENTKLNDIELSNGTRDMGNYYNSKIKIKEKDYFIGSFFKKSESVYAFFDVYYLFHGKLHKNDIRRLTNDQN